MEERRQKENEFFDFTEAVEQAKTGDQPSFETLYWQSYPYLETEVKKYYKQQQDIEDVLQECYLKIYKNLGQLEDPKRFMGWALTICKRVLINRADYKERHEGKTDLVENLAEVEHSISDLSESESYRKEANPSAQVDASLVTDTVRTILEDLPDDQQMCIYLWMQGYTQAEISEELSMPLGTVKSNQRYAKKKITKELLRMKKDGTFDFSAVSADPMGAFLWLLERYFAQAPAVPPTAATLLPKVQAALGAEALAEGGALATSTAAGATTGTAITATAATAAGTAGSAATTAGRTATAGTVRSFLRKAMSDTGTAVTSVLLVVAVAIGAALGIQNVRTTVPVTPQPVSTTTVSRTRAATAQESTTSPSNNATDTGNGAGTGGRESIANTVTGRTPDPSGTPTAATANAGRGNTTTVVQRTSAAADRTNEPLVAEEVDISSVPNGDFFNDGISLGAFGADNVTVREPKVHSQITSLGSSNSNAVTLHVAVKNSLGKNILVKGFQDVTISSLLGQEIFQTDMNLTFPKQVEDGETSWFSVRIPENMIPQQRVYRYELEEGLFQSKVTVNYDVI